MSSLFTNFFLCVISVSGFSNFALNFFLNKLKYAFLYCLSISAVISSLFGISLSGKTVDDTGIKSVRGKKKILDLILRTVKQKKTANKWYHRIHLNKNVGDISGLSIWPRITSIFVCSLPKMYNDTHQAQNSCSHFSYTSLVHMWPAPAAFQTSTTASSCVN